MFNTPILLITFNRPEHTRKVFEEIKKQKPPTLFVFQDGTREGNKADVEKCKAVRSIFEEPIDWDCKLNTYYANENLGCGLGPTTAITWFFENVQQGIIIEDDAVPAPDFFEYAEVLLEKYKLNDQIKVIGSMHLDGKSYGDGSYHFTMMNRNLCAWATWKRVWTDFDYFMDKISLSQLMSAMMKYNATKKEINYWCDRLDEIHRNRLNESSWDMQFLMSIWLRHGMGICPNVNLSTNIGFDSEGTHTQDNKNAAANLSTGCILPLKHPTNIRILRNADLNYHKKYFQPNEYGWQGIKRMPYRFNKKLKKLFRHEGSWIKK